jgi:hypothetical protein
LVSAYPGSGAAECEIGAPSSATIVFVGEVLTATYDPLDLALYVVDVERVYLGTAVPDLVKALASTETSISPPPLEVGRSYVFMAHRGRYADEVVLIECECCSPASSASVRALERTYGRSAPGNGDVHILPAAHGCGRCEGSSADVHDPLRALLIGGSVVALLRWRARKRTRLVRSGRSSGGSGGRL